MNLGRFVFSPAGSIAHECWSVIKDHFHFVTLGNFVVMPNHVHGVLILENEISSYASETKK
jgi:REP element-mobilizing transposase RayT